jgi:glycosyltransferase involved in cell wall biosynthesis
MPKLPISAMIVGYNEEKLLPACLASIDFCDEILYTDLGSTDSSIKIAEQYNAIIYNRNKANVPSCEMVQTEVVHYTKNDWVIFIDPDEVVDKDLQQQIINEFEKISASETIGAVTVPWQFYFKRKKLLGTVWGGSNKKYFLVNKHRFSFLPIIHYGRILKKAFTSYDIVENKNKTNVLHHYWMNSLKVFLQKHKRYLKNEGQDNYNAGTRVGIKKALLTPVTAFKESFITKQGYKDGLTGFFLSSFWAYYKTHIALDILRIQKTKK